MYWNETAAQKFRTHLYVDFDNENTKNPCDRACRLLYFCFATSSNYDANQFCLDNDKFDLSIGRTIIMTIEDYISYTWYQQ